MPIFPVTAPGVPQLQAMPTALYFAYLGVRLDGVRAQGQQLCLRIHLPDTGESRDLRLDNSVLHARSAADNTSPHLRCTRQQMLDLFEGRLSPEQAHRQGLLTADAPLEQLLALLTTFRQGCLPGASLHRHSPYFRHRCPAERGGRKNAKTPRPHTDGAFFMPWQASCCLWTDQRAPLGKSTTPMVLKIM